MYININFHNSRTSNDIDMKLGLLTETGNENIGTPKKVCGDVITENSDVIVIFPVYLSKNI